MLRTFLKKNKKGFTLTELMIVVIIIGILTAIAIPIYSSVTKNAKTRACQDNQRSITSAISQYMAAHPEYKIEEVLDEDKLAAILISEDEPYLAKMPDPPENDCEYSVDTNGVCTCSYPGHSVLLESDAASS